MNLKRFLWRIEQAHKLFETLHYKKPQNYPFSLTIAGRVVYAVAFSLPA